MLLEALLKLHLELKLVSKRGKLHKLLKTAIWVLQEKLTIFKAVSRLDVHVVTNPNKILTRNHPVQNKARLYYYCYFSSRANKLDKGRKTCVNTIA